MQLHARTLGRTFVLIYTNDGLSNESESKPRLDVARVRKWLAYNGLKRDLTGDSAGHLPSEGALGLLPMRDLTRHFHAKFALHL
jgi:hypothetical protein